MQEITRFAIMFLIPYGGRGTLHGANLQFANLQFLIPYGGRGTAAALPRAFMKPGF